MSKLGITILVFILIGGLITACKKYREVFLKPRLFITLKDDSARAVSGAAVKLYKGPQDTVRTVITDSTGSVLIENLDEVLYYWYVQKGCTTNMASQYTLNRPLIEDAVLYGYSIMSPTGLLQITTTTTETYKVSDSLFSARVHIDTPYIAYKRTGSYRIRTEKINMPGIFRDTIVQVNCSDTTRLVLPF